MKIDRMKITQGTAFGRLWRSTARKLLFSGLTACLLVGEAFAAAPANDNFANATAISGTGQFTGSNVGATRQPTDPTTVRYTATEDTAVGVPTVWFRWNSSSVSGPVTITTQGSDFDTQLWVSSGSTAPGTEIADNEDAGGSYSTVNFNATANTAYNIMVSGYQDAAGNITLTIDGQGGGGNTNEFLLTLQSSPANAGTITADPPSANNRYTNGTEVTLTATPNQGFEFVRWENAATGTSNTVVVTMTANRTARAVFRAVGGGGGTNAVLTVNVEGSGRVNPNLNGREVRVGRRVRLTAIPNRGNLFQGWTASDETLNTSSPSISFTMAEGLTLTARFVTNRFTAVKGTYVGLIMPTEGESFTNTGTFRIVVSDRGTYTGQVLLGGKRFPVSGRLDPETGAGTIRLGRGDSAPQGTLTLSLDEGSNRLEGVIADAPLLGHRQAFDGRTTLAPFAGNYTVALPGADSEPATGTGYARMTVDGKGTVRMVGVLPDGTAFAQSTIASGEGLVPVYVTLYGNRGALIGWLGFENKPDSSVDGTLDWFRPANARSPFRGYAAGFHKHIGAIGSLYLLPPRGIKVMNWPTNVVVDVSGGNLTEPFNGLFVLRQDNSIVSAVDEAQQTIVPTNQLTIQVAPNGLLVGRFRHPDLNNSQRAILGTVLQKLGEGGGFFLGTNESGNVTVGHDGENHGGLPSAPASLAGQRLSITTSTHTGFWNRFQADAFDFSDTAFTSSDLNGNYSYNAAEGTGTAELNFTDATISGRKVVIRTLLFFTSSTGGYYISEVTAGGTGKAAGTFSIAETPAP